MGLFIVFEGSDGSGKTSRAKKLVQLLNNNGYSSFYTKEPQDTVPGKKVIKGKDLFSFSIQDRYLHQKEISELKEKYDFAICDRYALSGSVYHTDKNEIALSRYKQQLNLFTVPDLTVFVNTPLETCKERVISRGGDTVKYDLDNIETFRNRYLETIWEASKKEIDKNILLVEGENFEDDLKYIFQYLINISIK